MNVPTKLPPAPQLIVMDNPTPTMATSKGELVPVPPPPPTITELVAVARQAHSEAEAASLTAVVKGMEVGKTLAAIKSQLPHGSFEDFVDANFPFGLKTAQNYMKMARQEPMLRELVATKAALGSHLTIREALTFLRSMDKKRKRKAKGRAEPSEAASGPTT